MQFEKIDNLTSILNIQVSINTQVHTTNNFQLITPVNDQNQNLSIEGYTNVFQFQAFSKKQEGTTRICVGYADKGNQNYRYMLNHTNKSNKTWEDQKQLLNFGGWTQYFEFYAYENEQPGTIQAQAVELMNPHRAVLCFNDLNKKISTANKNNILKTFYVHPVQNEKQNLQEQQINNPQIYSNKMFSEEISQIEIVGNGSHAARNILAMKKRLEYPELNAIDTQVAVIEGQAREIIIQFEKNPNQALMTAKPILRSVYRNLRFVERTLNYFKELEYQPLDDKNFIELYENIILQKKIIENVDNTLNLQYCNFVKNDNDNLVNKESNKLEQKDLQLQKDLEFKTKPDYKGCEANLEQLIEYTKDICNRAHHMQSYVCPLQAVEAVKAQANQIIGSAGNIENQTRAMLTNYDVHSTNPEQIKKVVINQSKAMGEQVKILNKQIEILNSMKYEEESKYLYSILSWIVDSFGVYDQVAKSPANKIVYAF